MASVIEMLDAATRAKSALLNSPIYVLREIQVESSDEALLLRGRVDTFYHKQLAQELVRAVADGMRVINTIAVD
ncbi:MAG TPA: BON domain-containing protein [Pirellulaceae bacterium]|nr:BON domain-containing protein [Pirellulaceae bacterium]